MKARVSRSIALRMPARGTFGSRPFGDAVGRPLPPAIARSMTDGLGHDFSRIRIVEGEHVADLGAKALTQGERVHFAPGMYQPWSASGRRVLAHELAHVVQQREGLAKSPEGSAFPWLHDAKLEAQADQMSDHALGGRPILPRLAAGDPPGAAANAPIQPLIAYSGGTFSKTKRRPGWTPYLKRHVIEEYNKNKGTTLTPKTNVGKLKPPLDRAHIYGYANIQHAVLQHVQGNLSEAKLRKHVLGALYPDQSTAEYDRVDQLVDDLQGLHGKAKASKANTLLRHLNSATSNVRLGDASTNRAIQEKLDFNYQTKKGVVSLTPRSKYKAKQAVKFSSGIRTGGLSFTPKRTHLRSSGPGPTMVSPHRASPVTGNLLKQLKKKPD